MNIALPILLLLFGGLSFWVLSESSVKWYVKTACISVFCFFTIIFWLSIHTFLGWAALESSMPEKMSVHWVIIKEPDKLTDYKGDIYILSESADKKDGNFLARFFGYGSERIEPRLYKLKYNRELHEKLQGIKDKLKNGNPVMGKFTKKGSKKGKAKIGDSKKTGKDGEGSESQEQDWEFHELLPSEIHEKPNR